MPEPLEGGDKWKVDAQVELCKEISKCVGMIRAVVGETGVLDKGVSSSSAVGVYNGAVPS